MLRSKSLLFLSSIPSLSSLSSNMTTPSASDDMDAFEKAYQADMEAQYMTGTTTNEGSFDSFNESPNDSKTTGKDASANDGDEDTGMDDNEGTYDDMYQHVRKEFETFSNDLQNATLSMVGAYQSYFSVANQVASTFAQVQENEHAEDANLDQLGAEIDGLAVQFDAAGGRRH
ncbi:hypothetical protein MPSEU_000918100 [Mayamaea pseudoterrestris]|nr:hypothetical protein MPSEU_000918100 [Mayamaea pseudoterrestris]